MTCEGNSPLARSEQAFHYERALIKVCQYCFHKIEAIEIKNKSEQAALCQLQTATVVEDTFATTQITEDFRTEEQLFRFLEYVTSSLMSYKFW